MSHLCDVVFLHLIYFYYWHSLLSTLSVSYYGMLHLYDAVLLHLISFYYWHWPLTQYRYIHLLLTQCYCISFPSTTGTGH